MKIGNLESPVIIDGTWKVIYDSGELAAALTSFTITGLQGDTDEEYKVISRFVSNTASGGSTYFVDPNADDGRNIGYQYISGNDTTVAADRDTLYGFSIGLNSTPNYICFGDIIIHAKSGYVRTAISNQIRSINGTTVTDVRSFGMSWNNTADEITSLRIRADVDNGIGIGSRIILLKKVTVTTGIPSGLLEVQNKVYGVWQEIYRNEVTEAATSVTISGLTGNTDVLYRLRTKIVNGVNGTGYTYCRINDDGTAANYGTQNINGVDTAAAAARSTAYAGFLPLGAGTALGQIYITNALIYAKSGFVRTSILEQSTRIETTSVYSYALWGIAWNNTSSEITSLVLQGQIGNDIGVGSEIILERLNL